MFVRKPHRRSRSDNLPRGRPAARLIPTLIALVLVSAFTARVGADTKTVTYLENSDNELTIYFITGREPGNTMMIIGGIQGDEPGGYLAADLYADILLEKGNLIVVPRANFNSIRMNQRGVNGDMNRRFSEVSDGDEDTDQHIVEILKSLIQQSDVLLNLHDGSGFYYPLYLSDMRNPMRFGQSIIADAIRIVRPDSTIIDLEGPALRVIEQVNRNIKDPDHIFRFNNHNTISEETLHREQRMSATYYSLIEIGIPAFGIETSKSITPVSTKVKYQTLVINAFMAEYGIIPEHPSVSLPEPELDYLVVQIVGEQHHFAVGNGETLSVPAGCLVHITDIVANYKRGLSVDIEGIGDSNDLGQVVVVNRPTVVNVYKDSFLCGKIAIETDQEYRVITESITGITEGPGRLTQITFTVDGTNIVVAPGDTLHIVRGDIISIADAQTTNRPDRRFRVNFVGFVGNTVVNDAEDRGYRIDTGRGLLERFSLDGGSLYRVDAEDIATNRLIGSAYVMMNEPKVEYLILERQDGVTLALTPGSVVTCDPNEQVRVVAVVSNITVPPYLEMYVKNTNRGEVKLSLPEVLEMSPNTEIQFRRSTTNLGSIVFGTSG